MRRLSSAARFARHRRYIEKQSLVAYLGKESAAALGLVVPAKAKAGRES